MGLFFNNNTYLYVSVFVRACLSVCPCVFVRVCLILVAQT